MQIEPIAHIHTDFPTKFGVPRQSGLASELTSTIVFAPAYRNPDCLRGIADFSHLWLIWEFDKVAGAGWSPTVLPPKLGGKTRVGVFATRSPFRPNPLGLSCVRLLGIGHGANCGAYLRIAGADMMDGTPVYDVKPYIPYADCHPDALSGFAPDSGAQLRVECPDELMRVVPADKRAALTGVLANDPRPRYQNDPDRAYAMDFAGLNVEFTVSGEVLTVKNISDRREDK